MLTNFRANLLFTPTHGIQGNPIIVRSVEVNAVDYAVALAFGAGLRDKEITPALTKIKKSQELSKIFLYPQKI